jgi:hypothetical protein
MLEKREELSQLFYYYGELLTEKQKEIFLNYYYEDLSLGEIALNFEITRQAVYDTLKKSEKSLFSFEKKVGMLKENRDIKNRVNSALSVLREIVMDDEDKNKLRKSIISISDFEKGTEDGF